MEVPRIAVLGSINMDLVIRCGSLPVPGETLMARSSTEVCGGKGANQAVAASRLGGKVHMLGRVGSDSFADRLLNNLHANDIDCEGVEALRDSPSGLAVVAVDDAGQNSILVVPGANGHVTPDVVDQHWEIIRRCDVLVCQLELPVDAVAHAIERAHREGKQVILNPAPAPTHPPDAFFRVDLICPNQLEAESMLGYALRDIGAAEAAARDFVSRGAKQAIITLGDNGAVVADNHQTLWLPPFPVQAVDTTAAGDAFIGALSVHWLQTGRLFESARFASAAAAISVTRAGAQPSLPLRSEVETLLATPLSSPSSNLKNS